MKINAEQQTEEILDLVDEYDCVIGQLERTKVHEKQLHNFRVVNAFLINDLGQLWIPRRTAHKRLFPLHLDVSVGGHVSAGESYEQAIERETFEEINLKLHDLQCEDLGLLTPIQHGVSAFMHVYKFHYNDVPNYNTDDFIEYYWLTPAELKKRIATIDKAKGDIPLLLNYFF